MRKVIESLGSQKMIEAVEASDAMSMMVLNIIKLSVLHL